MGATLKTITDAIFINRRSYKDLTDKDKTTFFFIFNRYMAKKFPLQAQALNGKEIDKASAMDIWYLNFKNQLNIPGWFWGKKKAEVKSDYDKKDITRFLIYNELRMEDFEMLNLMYPDELKEEVKRLKKLEDTLEKIGDDI